MAPDLVQPPAKGKKNAAVPPHSHLDSALKGVELRVPKGRGILMKFVVAAAVAITQVAAAGPGLAAELQLFEVGGASRVGTFVGARVRVPLGATRERPHAGLAFTSMQQSEGSAKVRFSKGLELGFAGDERLRLSLNGAPAARLAPGGKGPEGRRAGVSTIGWVAIGAGVAALALVGWFVHEMNSCAEHDDEC